MILAIAIFLYGKLFLEDKLYIRTLIVIVLFGVFGFARFKYVENTFDKLVANVETLVRGKKVITGKVETIGKSTNSNYFVLSNCYSEGLYIGKCRCYFSDELISDVKVGNLVKILGGLNTIDEPLNEGEFNQSYYYRSDGITFTAFANSIEVSNAKYNVLNQKIYEIKNELKAQISKIFNEKDAGLFSAMITGDKTTIDKIQKKRFSDNGIAHILAISGLHLSILGLGLFYLLRKKLSVNTAALLTSIFILLYGIFIDAGPSSMRAITMLYIRFLSLSIGRTYDSKNTLYIIAFIFIILKPYLIYNAGFQFSYIAIFALNTELNVAYIVKKEKNIESIENDETDKSDETNKLIAIEIEKRKIPAVLILTLFLFPVTIFHYFTYPLYSIILNLIVIPLMTFVLGFGLASVGISFLSLPLSKILSYAVHVIFLIYDKLCELIEKLPAHTVVFGKPTLYEMLYYYIVIFLVIYVINDDTNDILNTYQENNKLYNYSNQNKRDFIKQIKSKQFIKVFVCIIALLLSSFIISIRNHSDMRMTFIAIGQGDSILIESNNLVMTIDGGSTSNTSNGQYVLAPHIKSRAIDHIDFSFITHADSDHTNGIMHLLENEDEIKIKNLVLPITANGDAKFNKIISLADKSNVNILYVKETEIIMLKEKFYLTILSPNEMSLNNKKRDENEMSLTFRLDYNNHSALYTGDIGIETIGRLLKDEFALKHLDVDILKVPHHGSKNSNVKDFYDLVSPKYSVFSYGKNNNYGHPSKDTLESVENTGSKILKTAESGQIDIYLDKDIINVKTFK